jgi:hypothetical protein
MRTPAAGAEVTGGPGAAQSVAAPACRNCGAKTGGHYCANCGQETALQLPTFRSFMRDAAGRYVALDGRLWRTLFGLVARPGFLTLEYFAGRRRRYIRPARLFLVLYLLLFAVIGLVQSPADLGDEIVFVQSDDAAVPLERPDPRTPAAAAPDDVVTAPRNSAESAVTSDPGGANADAPGAAAGAKGTGDGRDGTQIGLDKDLNLTMRVGGADLALPEPLRKRYARFKQLPKDEKAERLYAGALRYGPYAMVALLPAFALLLKLVNLGRGGRYPTRPQRYAEHLVYSAHLHSFAAAVLIAMVALPWPDLRPLLALWVVFYVLRARHVVYGGPWWAGILRTTVVATVYTVLISLAMLALLVAAVMLR